MKLLKHYQNNLHPPRLDCKLFKTDNNTWVKEIKINDPNFDGYDINTLKKFIDKFDFIAKPLYFDYNDEIKIFRYELKDYSHGKFLIDFSYSEQIKIFKYAIEIIHSCMNFSHELGYDEIFCHNDFNIFNIFVENDKIILIDFDSFRWMTMHDFHKFFQYTMVDLPSKFNLTKL